MSPTILPAPSSLHSHTIQFQRLYGSHESYTTPLPKLHWWRTDPRIRTFRQCLSSAHGQCLRGGNTELFVSFLNIRSGQCLRWDQSMHGCVCVFLYLGVHCICMHVYAWVRVHVCACVCVCTSLPFVAIIALWLCLACYSTTKGEHTSRGPRNLRSGKMRQEVSATQGEGQDEA